MMTFVRPLVKMLTLACLVIGGPLAFGADWIQWGGRPDKNMVSDEKGLPDTFAPGEKDPQGGGIKMETTQNVRWAARIGAMTCSTPAVAGGKVFIGTMRDDLGLLLCLDEATGKPLWQWVGAVRDVPALIDGRRCEFTRFPRQLGVCSSPAIDGDRLYFVDQRLNVLCVTTAGKPKSAKFAAAKPAAEKPAEPAKPAEGNAKEKSGKAPAPKVQWPEGPGEADVVWEFDLWNFGIRPSDACDCSPVYDDKFVYVISANGVDRQAEANKHDELRKVPAPDAPNVIVLDKKTGRLVATDDVRYPDRMMHGQWSSLALGEVGGKKLIFFGGGDGRCYAFETPATAATPDGKPAVLKKVWVVDCNPKEYQVFGDMSLIMHYCMGDRRRSDALNKVQDGSFVGMSEIIATPVFYKNRVYIAIGRDPEHGRGRGALWCIDATKTGDITESGKIWCYQGLDRSLSTVSIADGLVYCSDVAGRLHCVDAETGKPYWVFESSSKVWGSTLVADGKVYMPTEKGLWVFAAGKELKLLNKIILGAPAWPTPVAANGTLFVTSKNWMWAVEKRPAAAK
ncbi:MAG: PQQ-binding-like beta-propeller repeat protein [Planctomycetota bacterium]|nr:PQQ-binding-like beta-propeller repeat protein [Planctomycetota bacterium]